MIDVCLPDDDGASDSSDMYSDWSDSPRSTACPSDRHSIDDLKSMIHSDGLCPSRMYKKARKNANAGQTTRAPFKHTPRNKRSKKDLSRQHHHSIEFDAIHGVGIHATASTRNNKNTSDGIINSAPVGSSDNSTSCGQKNDDARAQEFGAWLLDGIEGQRLGGAFTHTHTREERKVNIDDTSGTRHTTHAQVGNSRGDFGDPDNFPVRESSLTELVGRGLFPECNTRQDDPDKADTSFLDIPPAPTFHARDPPFGGGRLTAAITERLELKRAQALTKQRNKVQKRTDDIEEKLGDMRKKMEQRAEALFHAKHEHTQNCRGWEKKETTTRALLSSPNTCRKGAKHDKESPRVKNVYTLFEGEKTRNPWATMGNPWGSKKIDGDDKVVAADLHRDQGWMTQTHSCVKNEEEEVIQVDRSSNTSGGGPRGSGVDTTETPRKRNHLETQNRLTKLKEKH